MRCYYGTKHLLNSFVAKTFFCVCVCVCVDSPNMYDYTRSSIRVCTCWEASGRATGNGRRVAPTRRRHSHAHTAGFIHVIIVVFSRSGTSHLRWCSCLHGCVKHVFRVFRRERPTAESNIQPSVLLMRRWGNMCNNISHYLGGVGGEWTVGLQRCHFLHLLVAFLLLTRMSCKSVITRPSRVLLTEMWNVLLCPNDNLQLCPNKQTKKKLHWKSGTRLIGNIFFPPFCCGKKMHLVWAAAFGVFHRFFFDRLEI